MALGITENIPTSIATLQVLAVVQTWVTDNTTGIACKINLIFLHNVMYKAPVQAKNPLTLIKCNTTNFNFSDTATIVSKGIDKYMCIKEKEQFIVGGAYSSNVFK
jgi:hypothetical protein